MRIFEHIAAGILAVTEFIAAAALDGTGGVWAWWVLAACTVLQLTAMVLVKITAHENIEEVRK